MPKLVDPVGRRRELAEAVWRVVRRDGLAGASVRAVAREAGLSMGSLRHYFGSQSELLIFAMRLVVERITARVAALERPDDPLRAAALVLAQFVPLDREREVENEVWLAFTAQALVEPELRALREEAHDALQSTCERLVRLLLPPGATEVDVDRETHRLFALLDGLAVHAAVRPEQSTPQRLVDVLNHHLADIAGTRDGL
jgi:AcrR family transcriptional regulator